MKKIFTLIAAVAIVLTLSVSANAQVKFGVKGGINFSNVTGTAADFSKDALKGYTGFHAGIAVNIPLGLGFALQPELIYTQNGTNITETLPLLGDATLKITQGTIQLPIGIQWGIKLGPVRPFVMAVPYIGYALSHNVDATIGKETERIDKELLKEYWNALDYGVGAGVGIDIWKFQVAAKYNWALGNLVKDIDGGKYPQLEDFQKSKISGLEISVAFLF